MKNVKGVVEGIGNIFGNPKLRGTVQIIFWIIFFFIVAMIFRSSKTSSIPKDDNVTSNTSKTETVDVVSSYEYQYAYTENNNLVNIVGTYFNGKESFDMNGYKYYQVNNKYYDALSKNIVDASYAFDEWRYNNIKNITNHNSYINQTKYKNGIEKYEYNIDANIYNSYYNRNYSNNIIISITKENNIITSTTINYGFSSVDIKYSNINEIDNLDINID